MRRSFPVYRPRCKKSYNIRRSVERPAYTNVSLLIEYIPQKGALEVVSK